ncbi:aminotransferase class IV [Maribacter sp. 2307ULW6-5]|uniref:aminotransferase class IV n=1 Tax=Maribacter sp. 2307ULW6-5 TaxID=3386275 RepID=UPI0039BD6D0A
MGPKNVRPFFMVNFNGELKEEGVQLLGAHNRGLGYGDALFESVRVAPGHVYFLEEHYLRLMASMRILRMEIPMRLTMEFFEEQLLRTLEAHDFAHGALMKFLVFRNNGGHLLPKDNHVSFLVQARELEHPFYVLHKERYEVELFKDFHKAKDMLSGLNTVNKQLQISGSIYAHENGYDNCMLINHDKNVVEFLNGNLFLVSKKTVKTPPLADGCTNGIIRKKVLDLLQNLPDLEVLEASVSPFELQRADELFMTNIDQGIVPVTKYRKKEFGTQVGQSLIGKLNAAARLAK